MVVEISEITYTISLLAKKMEVNELNSFPKVTQTRIKTQVSWLSIQRQRIIFLP